jgi:hypothetical protein
MPKIGLGATLAVNDGSGGAGSDSAIIVDILSLTVPDREVQFKDSKKLNQSDRIIQKVAAMDEPGTFQFTYEFSTGKKTRLDALIGSARVFVVTLPTDTGSAWTRTVPGVIASNKQDSVVADEIQTVTCTVQVTGAAS